MTFTPFLTKFQLVLQKSFPIGAAPTVSQYLISKNAFLFAQSTIKLLHKEVISEFFFSPFIIRNEAQNKLTSHFDPL